jgi:hypothetical protein
MVGAVLITGILIYFFFWSRKVRKEQKKEWELLGIEDEREEIEGLITYVFTQKKRFSPQYWYIETQANIYDEKAKQTIKVIWKKPFTDHLHVPHLSKNQMILVKGNRRQDVFYANYIQLLDKEIS